MAVPFLFPWFCEPAHGEARMLCDPQIKRRLVVHIPRHFGGARGMPEPGMGKGASRAGPSEFVWNGLPSCQSKALCAAAAVHEIKVGLQGLV